MKALIITLLCLGIQARISSLDCFAFSDGTMGVDNGTSFTHLDYLSSELMTVKMRISQIRVCVHNTTSIITGMQIKLSDSFSN